MLPTRQKATAKAKQIPSGDDKQEKQEPGGAVVVGEHVAGFEEGDSVVSLRFTPAFGRAEALRAAIYGTEILS